jgi:hypothetical protein
MIDLNQALEFMKFDVRMRDWNLKRGTISKDDVEKHVKSINDSSASAEPVTLEDKEDFS